MGNHQGNIKCKKYELKFDDLVEQIKIIKDYNVSGFNYQFGNIFNDESKIIVLYNEKSNNVLLNFNSCASIIYLKLSYNKKHEIYDELKQLFDKYFHMSVDFNNNVKNMYKEHALSIWHLEKMYVNEIENQIATKYEKQYRDVMEPHVTNWINNNLNSAKEINNFHDICKNESDMINIFNDIFSQGHIFFDILFQEHFVSHQYVKSYSDNFKKTSINDIKISKYFKCIKKLIKQTIDEHEFNEKLIANQPKIKIDEKNSLEIKNDEKNSLEIKIYDALNEYHFIENTDITISKNSSSGMSKSISPRMTSCNKNSNDSQLTEFVII
jgi:hypothetical protein